MFVTVLKALGRTDFFPLKLENHTTSGKPRPRNGTRNRRFPALCTSSIPSAQNYYKTLFMTSFSSELCCSSRGVFRALALTTWLATLQTEPCGIME